MSNILLQRSGSVSRTNLRTNQFSDFFHQRNFSFNETNTAPVEPCDEKQIREWQTQFYRKANELDAITRLLDDLIEVAEKFFTTETIIKYSTWALENINAVAGLRNIHIKKAMIIEALLDKIGTGDGLKIPSDVKLSDSVKHEGKLLKGEQVKNKLLEIAKKFTSSTDLPEKLSKEAEELQSKILKCGADPFKIFQEKAQEQEDNDTQDFRIAQPLLKPLINPLPLIDWNRLPASTAPAQTWTEWLKTSASDLVAWHVQRAKERPYAAAGIGIAAAGIVATLALPAATVTAILGTAKGMGPATLAAARAFLFGAAASAVNATANPVKVIRFEDLPKEISYYPPGKTVSETLYLTRATATGTILGRNPDTGAYDVPVGAENISFAVYVNVDGKPYMAGDFSPFADDGSYTGQVYRYRGFTKVDNIKAEKDHFIRPGAVIDTFVSYGKGVDETGKAEDRVLEKVK